jgi:hypothetical protein
VRTRANAQTIVVLTRAEDGKKDIREFRGKGHASTYYWIMTSQGDDLGLWGGRAARTGNGRRRSRTRRPCVLPVNTHDMYLTDRSRQQEVRNGELILT